MKEFLGSYSKLEYDKVKRHIQRYSVSDLGREYFDRLAPSSDRSQIQHQLALVSEMKRLLESDEYPPLDNLFDLRTSLHRSSIEDYVLPSEEIRKVALLLETSAKTRAYFSRRSKEFDLLNSLAAGIQVDKILEYNINQAIDEDGKVKDSASKELSSVRRQIKGKTESLRRSLEVIVRSLAAKEWVQEEITTTREGRMVIPVKAEHKNHVPGFIHSSSASGATVFIEPAETLELNNDIRSLTFEERREVEKILKELTQQVRERRDTLLINLRLLGELDFLQAKAKYSIECLGAEPRLADRKALKLVNALHPILLTHHRRQDVVPLDMEFGEEYRTLVITGPNAGGKSVAMKTVGILALLVQSGCHVPLSSESVLPVFSELFVDMGDEQSIENDLSSFSSHLDNLKFVLEHATPDSLVLIDEIGSGTDPTEGASIAASVLERLTGIGCSTIVTTHHGALKAFAFETPGIENGSMEFDQATLQPTYRFKSGVPGSSYAIEMAERLHLPSQVIERARILKGTQASKLEDLILDLERRSQELSSMLDTVRAEKRHLEEMLLVYETRIKGLEKEGKEIKKRALEEARSIVAGANASVEKVVKEIREKSADRSSLQTARSDLERIRQDLTWEKNQLEEKLVNTRDYNPGDPVRLKGSSSTGEVVDRIDNAHYIVLMGTIRVKVRGDELHPVEQVKQDLETRSHSHAASSEAKTEVDLRGMYAEEAIAAVEKGIDDAILKGLHRIDIIHGKGTGALRKKVAQYLKNNSAIRSYRLGEWNEGGSGVTVVELL